MITFREFLREEKTSLEDLVQIYLANCADTPAWSPLWRLSGLRNKWSDNKADWVKTKHGGPQHRETRTRKERSKAGTESIQKFLEDLDSWQGIPNRGESVFCSTTTKFDVGDADDQHLYAVYPYNNVTLAVTEAQDFNFIAFSQTSVTMFESDLLNFYKNVIEKRSYGSMKAMVLELQEFFENGGQLPKTDSDYLKIKWKAMMELINGFPESFSPEKLGIRTFAPTNFPKKYESSQHEVWFEGKYIMIPADQHEKFKQLVQQIRDK